MQSGETEPQPSAAEPSALSKTRASAALAPRARAIVEAIAEMAQTWLQPQWDMALDELELELFRLAERANSNVDERACLDSLSLIRAKRAELAPCFVHNVCRQLSRFGDDFSAAPDTLPHAPLELLDAAALEEHIALDEMAARSEARTGALMFDLGHRFAVLIASPVLDLEQLPVGPYAISRALQASIDASELPTKHRVTLYQQFDRKAMARIEAFFAAVNDYLIAQRILPKLRVFMPLRRDGEASAAASASAADAQATRAAKSPAAESADARSSPPSTNETAATPATDTFAQLGALLRQQRQAPTTVAKGRVASTDQLQQVLADLQTRAAAPQGEQTQAPPRNMQQLRRDMLAQLRHRDPEARTPRLAPEQLDVVELMTMLFDRLDGEVGSDNGRDLLSKVQTPLLRVALDNHDFFTEHQHPARRWLNSATEACARWGGDNESRDAALVTQLQSMVSRINRDYDGDPAMFDAMRADIDRHVETLERKAQVTERRYIEAAKGRERLQVSRMRATELIDERLAGKKVTSLNRALLQQAWADVLALTLLREGEDSETFQQQLHIADALSDEQLTDATDTDELREDIEHGLTQVGIDAHDAEHLATKVTRADADIAGADGEPVTRTELALKLKQRKRIGASGDDEAQADNPPPLASVEEEQLAQLKTLPFGTWFDVDSPPPQPPVQRKMAWYSTQTGRCLLVNQRGVRADDTTLIEMAKAMAAGSTRLVPAERPSLIDRTWDAIVAKVKSLTVLDAATPEAT